MKVLAVKFWWIAAVPTTKRLSDFPGQELNLSGLGGSLLPFQVEAVRYAVERKGRRYWTGKRLADISHASSKLVIMTRQDKWHRGTIWIPYGMEHIFEDIGGCDLEAEVMCILFHVHLAAVKVQVRVQLKDESGKVL